ncbi:QacE family quaternary ammonium compound efflux SMR transporter [Bermanella marisrubri]|uniref:Putative mebrane transport protein n=1 Tax=Bermanella marisrubri TaxID=207949 RepID=Q1N5X5_9GAMM|nr:SMR family transporter [Bermanella marisrubri]EAT13817.1 putative mebrane transport protein [Oceanobacter sp. RED65] [Bermanella marisrubri]QIZ84583.1 QacE family quaternary ammonium compound efflux SMR transporter [Bermanella marisrubri]
MNSWLLLMVAILAEVIGTSSLKASEGFTKLWPSIGTVIGFSIAFYCLSLTLKVIPVGVAYAVWAGLGIVLITLIGWWLFGQTLDWAAVLGMGLIVTGVVIMNVFSKSVSH